MYRLRSKHSSCLELKKYVTDSVTSKTEKYSRDVNVKIDNRVNHITQLCTNETGCNFVEVKDIVRTTIPSSIQSRETLESLVFDV